VELEHDNAILREEGKVDMLVGLDLPVLESGQVDLEHLLVELVLENDLCVEHVHRWLVVSDLAPREVVIQQPKEKSQGVIFGLFQVRVVGDEVGQEVLHGPLSFLDCVLSYSDSDSRWAIEGIN
jgi:hypothetical protein